MEVNGTENYIQKIFFAVFCKYLPEYSDVVAFSERTGIPLNTLKDIYYKDGQAGIGTMDRVLRELLDLKPDKVDSLLNKISRLEPVSKSTAIWNSINATEERKLYYALVAKSLAEIDAKLEKDSKKKGLPLV